MAGGDAPVLDWLLSVQPSTWNMVVTSIGVMVPIVWAMRKDAWQQGGVRRKEAVDAQRQDKADLRTDQQSILDWHRGEVVALRKQVADAEAERDTWEARARWWYSQAHDMLGQLREARHLAANYSTIIGGLVARNGIPDPGLTELPDSPPRLPARIENIEEEA